MLAQNPAAILQFSGTSNAATFAGACTPGSLIVAEIVSEGPAGGNPFTSISDGVNAGNYTVDVQNYSAGSGLALFASMVNTSSTALTVTVTLNAACTSYIKIYELTGSTGLDSSASGTGAGTSHTINLTTLSDNCSIFAAGTHTSPTAGPDTGFTTGHGPSLPNTLEMYGEYFVDSGVAQLRALSFGLGTQPQWVIAAAAYKT